MKFKKFALLAMSTLALAACGGSDSYGDGGAPFIKGTVDGIEVNATTNVRGDWATGEKSALRLTASIDPATEQTTRVGPVRAWSINFLKPLLNVKQQCTNSGEDDLQIELMRDAEYSLSRSCTVTVTRVNEKEISGTFVAILETNPRTRESAFVTVNVTKGSFKVPRTGVVYD